MSSLLLLLILACPLMMFFMMRGLHGGHGGTAEGSHAHAQGGSRGHDHTGADPSASLEELRRQRNQLDRQVEAQEAEEQTPVGSGWR